MAIHRITPIHLIRNKGQAGGDSSMHPADIKTRKAQAMDNKRALWKEEAIMPTNRVAYLAFGDIPGGGSETGFVHSRHTSAITWDRHSQKWVPATYATAPEGVNKTARLVKSAKA